VLRRTPQTLSVFFAVALAVIGALLLLATCGSSAPELVLEPDPGAASALTAPVADASAVDASAIDDAASATATATEAGPTVVVVPTTVPTDEPAPTEIPTETPVPAPTAVLMAAQSVFDQHFARADLTGKLTSPIECDVIVESDVAATLSLEPTAAAEAAASTGVSGLPTVFRCAEPLPQLAVKAGAAGRVVMVARSTEGQLTEPPPTYAEWTWQRGLSLGNYVVIDHGPVPPWTNLMTLHAGLSAIPPGLLLGETVEPEQIIGRLDDGAPLQYEIWPQGQPLTITVSEPPAREATPADLAAKLALNSVPPVDPVCRFPAREPSSLPNAARPYRNGTHRGVDFVCNRRGLDTYAFADGQVAMVVRDYEDAEPANRNALLRSGIDLGDTPHWTLLMLYGNFVVIDHGDLPDIGPSFTIYAHLEEVDPGVVLGQPITMGARVGEVGNRGTNDAASGTTAQNPRSLHLHWELHTEGQFLGAGLAADESETAYRLLLCDDQTLLEGC